MTNDTKNEQVQGIKVERLEFDENGQFGGLSDADLDAVAGGLMDVDDMNMNCACGIANGKNC